MRSAVLALTCAACAGSAIAWGGGRDDRVIAACEDAIKSRLKAPATYARIRATMSEKKATRGQYFFHLVGIPRALIDERIAEFESGSVSVSIHYGSITYDAANSFGVPIRSATECSFVSVGGRDPTPQTVDVGDAARKLSQIR